MIARIAGSALNIEDSRPATTACVQELGCVLDDSDDGKMMYGTPNHLTWDADDPSFDSTEWSLVTPGSPMALIADMVGLPTIRADVDDTPFHPALRQTVGVPRWMHEVVSALWPLQAFWDYAPASPVSDEARDDRTTRIAELLRDGPDGKDLQAVLAAASLGLP